MSKTTYIKTDDNTANLAELLLAKLESMERDNKALNVAVCTLTNMPDSAQLYTEKEAASKLSISPRTLINLRNEKKIHYRQISTSIRYSLADILEFQEKCKR